MTPRRRPKNVAEALFFDAAEAAGYDVCKRGWPDFLLEKDGKICAVEVKPKKGRKLKADQLRVLAWLNSNGIDAFLWTPDGGFTRVTNASDNPPVTPS